MPETGVLPKRAQEDPRARDVAIYAHALRRKEGDSADKMADLARLAPVGNKWLCSV